MSRLTKALVWTDLDDPDNEDIVCVAFPFGTSMGGYSIREDTHDTFYVRGWGVVYARHKAMWECKEVAEENFESMIRRVLA